MTKGERIQLPLIFYFKQEKQQNLSQKLAHWEGLISISVALPRRS